MKERLLDITDKWLTEQAKRRDDWVLSNHVCVQAEDLSMVGLDGCFDFNALVDKIMVELAEKPSEPEPEIVPYPERTAVTDLHELAQEGIRQGRLAAVMLEHLSKLPPEERERRLDAIHKTALSVNARSSKSAKLRLGRATDRC